MKHEYSIDLDVMKEILRCHRVDRVDWRISASGRGLHIIWTCHKRSCKQCTAIEKKFDDRKRYKHDLRRPRHHARILWDSKGGRKAGPWNVIQKPKQKQS